MLEKGVVNWIDGESVESVTSVCVVSVNNQLFAL